jgi:Tol biopolymer transport system component
MKTVLFLFGGALLLAQSVTEEWTSEKYPPYIRRVTYFGERPDWSHDGKKILFLEKTYGDVFELELATGIIRPVTHHYFHNGYTRALYLSNGDILLSGSKTFNPAEPTDSRFRTAELWVLSKNLDKPPVALGELCWEGPAVSRKQLKIAWAEKHGTYPRDTHLYQMWVADLDYSSGTPRIKNQKMVLDNRAYGEAILEAQNFRPPDEKELIYQSSQGGTEVMGIDLETGKVTDYSNSPNTYDEPEGIFPDGKSTLVESSRQHPVRAGIDLWRLFLDGSNRWERMTWFNEARKYQATNPVVSDDGRYFEFTVPAVGDSAGVGHGIYLYDLQAAAQARR